MEDADNYDFINAWKVVDCVISVEDYAQVRSQMGTGSTGIRERGSLAEASLDLQKEISCSGFGRFLGQVAPDFR